LFAAKAIISIQQLVAIQLGDGNGSGGALFSLVISAIHCWLYGLLGGVYVMTRTML